MSDEPRTFNELVAWAAWEVITGITQGKPIIKVMHGVLAYARGWQPQPDPTAAPPGDSPARS